MGFPYVIGVLECIITRGIMDQWVSIGGDCALYLYFIGDDEVLIYLYSNYNGKVMIRRFGG
jgi:hypothetical protein